MKADTLTIKTLFQKDIRYLIPQFQRPYVWNKDDQWEPLWDDVCSTAESYLHHMTTCSSPVEAEEKVTRHFLGAVVLQQQATSSAEIETRLVIDGQQRMTTLQLLLDAVQEVLETLSHSKEAVRLSRLVLNRDVIEDEMFKLWPTLSDRDGFRAAMTNGFDTSGYRNEQIVRAHDYFRYQTQAWLQSAETGEAQALRAHALEIALCGLLEVVVIDLELKDDPYVIFETLNARGTPLLASDLVKNFILQHAEKFESSTQLEIQQCWEPFYESWWRKDVRRGRSRHPQIDTFLNYWMVTRTFDEVPAHNLFRTFKRHAEESSQDLLEMVTALAINARAYRGFGEWPKHSPEGLFFYRLEVLDTTVFYPVLIWLFSLPEATLSAEERHRFLHILESFLVRRMICRLTTKDYNRMCIDMLDKFRHLDHAQAGDNLATYLLGQTADTRRWPGDAEVVETLKTTPVYWLHTQRRLRLILEAVEDSLRSPKSEEEHCKRNLQIEHIMPQQWHQHWPLVDMPIEEKDAAVEWRNHTLHGIGNLTLVNKKLNPTMSNSAWSKKVEELMKHSVLHLNKQLLTTYSDQAFEEAQILERSESLASHVLDVWPWGGDSVS